MENSEIMKKENYVSPEMEQITFVGERILDGSGTIELPDHEWVNNRRRAIEIFQEDK